MTKKDAVLYSAYRGAIKIVGRHRHIATDDMARLANEAGYPITPAEANEYILAQPQRVIIFTEGLYGMHTYGFSH